MKRTDNYAIQAAQAKLRFLTYDQQKLIAKYALNFDDTWLYTTMLCQTYRISRTTGDLEKLEGKDPYEVFLSGPRSLLTVTNPAGQPGKELIVFRDSFGSAIVPLLLADYETVTLVDIRYLQMDLLDRFVDFHGQDVLLLYSTLVLNNSETIK